MKYYKYIDNQHTKDFIENGHILFRSLSYYQHAEESIKDNHEGVHKYTPTDGLKLTDVKTGQTLKTQHETFQSSIKTDEIFVFCTSSSLDNNLYSKFQYDTCIEIHNTAEFTKRIETALAKMRKKKPPQLLQNAIKYYEDTDAPKEIWALPEKIAFSKLSTFQYEKEYRFAFSLTDAFDFQQTTLQLTSRKTTKETKRYYPERSLKIKNISDICTVHRKNLLTK